MAKPFSVLVAVALAVTAVPSEAAADSSYRGPIAISDLVGGAAFAGGVELGTKTSFGLALTIGGGVVAGLGGPLLHGLEGNGGRMAASIILRATLPPLGAYGGYLLSPEDNAKFRHGGGLIGFMAGFAVVTIVDIAMASTTDETGTSARMISFGAKF